VVKEMSEVLATFVLQGGLQEPEMATTRLAQLVSKKKEKRRRRRKKTLFNLIMNCVLKYFLKKGDWTEN